MRTRLGGLALILFAIFAVNAFACNNTAGLRTNDQQAQKTFTNAAVYTVLASATTPTAAPPPAAARR